MKCPVCSNASLVMSDRSGIEIDYCPDCRGVWLDRGELDKIIERSVAPAPQSQARPEERSSRNHSGSFDNSRNHRRKKSKTSLLGELFDF